MLSDLYQIKPFHILFQLKQQSLSKTIGCNLVPKKNMKCKNHDLPTFPYNSDNEPLKCQKQIFVDAAVTRDGKNYSTERFRIHFSQNTVRGVVKFKWVQIEELNKFEAAQRYSNQFDMPPVGRPFFLVFCHTVFSLKEFLFTPIQK